ncbi:androgen-induced gene 1 protein-like [Ostrinia furnacalis]|uniref:androgen-induced gene 1 protein-like n=1 Tax=Ostrinia furnacalis TaxID=93504 RepID=UPI0010403E8F|nr:androgen-induced gene 1 protein-like [Ostrinia furnacalis]
MALTLFHAAVISINVYTIMYDQMYLELPFTTGELYGELILKGRWSLVTFWCMGLQTVYFTLSLLNDLIGTNELSPSPQKKPLIRTIKDLTFALAFPMALFVTITFWALYFYEKNLVYPDEIDILVPHWVNLVLHVFNSVFICIELKYAKITFPPRSSGLLFSFLFNFGYIVTACLLRIRTGAWPYPLLEVLDGPSIVVFFTISILMGLFLYFLGEKLTGVTLSSNHVDGVNGSVKKRL